MKSLLATAALAAAAPAPAEDASRRVTFDELVVFGDSLSDTGNAGRFSNGPVWVEGLADHLALSARPSQMGGSNFAIGGARLDPASGPKSLPVQLARYRQRGEKEGRVLHVVYGGGNDLLAAALFSGGDPQVDAALAGLRSILLDLAEHGATDILVPNLPDIGMTPAAQEHGLASLNRARSLTERFNSLLSEPLDGIEARFSLRFYRLDVWEMAERARGEPAAFGFADVTTPCHGLPSCDGYLFWDGVHPTAEAHARLAEAAVRLIADGPSSPVEKGRTGGD